MKTTSEKTRRVDQVMGEHQPNRDYQRLLELGLLPVVIVNPRMLSSDELISEKLDGCVRYVGSIILTETSKKSPISLRRVD